MSGNEFNAMSKRNCPLSNAMQTFGLLPWNNFTFLVI